MKLWRGSSEQQMLLRPSDSADVIEIGGGVRLGVSGPALRCPSRIGWSVRPERIRFAEDAPYLAKFSMSVRPVTVSEPLPFNSETLASI